MMLKKTILKYYQQTLVEFSGRRRVLSALKQNLDYQAPHIVVIGKSADAMLTGALDILVPVFKSALIITKVNQFNPIIKNNSKITLLIAAHPTPDQSSLNAGVALITYLQNLSLNEKVLFLISGGTSSLVEVLIAGQTLDLLQQQTNKMLADGSDIFKINQYRKQVSKIKGGGLWHYLENRPVACLLISDVENNNPQTIGSGLLFDNQQSYLKRINFLWKIIATNSLFLEKMALKAEKAGFKVQISAVFLNMQTASASEICLNTLRKYPNKLHFWGAEITVVLPKNQGKGGRNQHLALTMALNIKADEDIFLWVIATDGEDGLTQKAGAFIDSNLINNENRPSALLALEKADSYTFLKQHQALITTPNTGTNIMDVVMGIKIPNPI